MRLLSQQPLPNGADCLQVFAVDNPEPGQPNNRYEITGFSTVFNRASVNAHGYPANFTALPLIFQDGPIRCDEPANGVTEYALLKVINDRLHSKQMGPHACPERQMAIDFISHAAQMLGLIPSEEPQQMIGMPGFELRMVG